MSLIATVIRAGRPFLRQLFSLLSMVQAQHHFVRLKVVARADLTCMAVFSGLERDFILPSSTPHLRYSFGRLRVIQVWGFLASVRLVSVSMAGQLAAHQHCGQGARPTSDGSRSLGKQLEAL